MATAGTLEYLISINSSQLNTGLSSAESKVKSFGTRLSAMSVALGSLMSHAAILAVRKTVNTVKTAIAESRSFDKAMSQYMATRGYSVEDISKKGTAANQELEKMTKFAREAVKDTAYTAQQAAEGLNYMALAGYDANISMRMLPSVLNLAAAGNMDLAKSSDMVTDAQSALGLSLSQTEDMVDQMAKTASLTNTNVEQLGDAFLTVGGTAKKLKGGTAELSALLGTLASAGIKGAEGGTALRNVLNGLSNPAGKAAKQLKNLKVEAYDGDGNLRSMTDILTDFNKALEGKTMKERTEIFAKAFNVRDLKSIEALLSKSSTEWDALIAKIEDSEGAAKKMADVQLNNLEGDVTKLKNTFFETKLALVEGLTPSLRNFTKAGTALLKRMTDAFKKGGFTAAIKEAKEYFRDFVKEMTKSENGVVRAIGNVIDWFHDLRDSKNLADIASTVIAGLKKAFSGIKVKVADILGIDEPGSASWGDIATKLVERVKAELQAIKIKVADFLGVEGADDSSWGDIAGKIVDRIKAKFAETKIKIADLLGVEDAQNATWGEIAGNISERIKGKLSEAKIKIADLLGVENAEDATWGEIAGNITERIKGKLTDAKIKIADLLGIEDAQEATWGEIAGNIAERIKGKLTDVKIKVADLLGIDGANEATWGTIAGNITQRIKDKLNGLKIKAADLLGIEDTSDITWGKIAAKVKNGLIKGISSLRLKAADIFGLENPNDASWADIGKKVMDGLTKYVSNKGNFLKQLILGESYSSESTWTDVGEKVYGWLTEAFADGGLISAILGKTSEIAEAAITFAGNLLTGIAQWVANNSGEVTKMMVGLVTAAAEAISQAAGPIITALAKVLADPKLWSAIGTGLESIGGALLEAIFGKDAANYIKRMFGGNVEGEIGSSARAAFRKAFFEAWDMDESDPQFMQMIATWNEMLGGVFKGLGLDDSFYNDFLDKFDFKKLKEQYNASGSNAEFFEQVFKDMEEFGGVDVKLKPDNEEIKKVCEQSYSATVTLNAVKGDGWPSGDDGDGLAKGNWYVPYDNYPALLHRGEMVLNKSQARQYRDGESGGTDVSGVVAKAVNQAMSKVYVMMSGEKVGDLTTKRVKRNINANSYSRMRALGG